MWAVWVASNQFLRACSRMLMISVFEDCEVGHEGPPTCWGRINPFNLPFLP